MKAISESRKRKIPNVVLVMSEISRVGGWEFQGTYTRAVNIRRPHQRVKARQGHKMLAGFALLSGASRDHDEGNANRNLELRVQRNGHIEDQIPWLRVFVEGVPDGGS